MSNAYRLLAVERHGDIASVRLLESRLDENEVYELADELNHLWQEDGCRRLALCLGPQTPEFLYSVFLAKLISLQRHLRDQGGELKLCQATGQVRDIFAACQLLDHFDFVEDAETAIQQWTA